MTSAENEEMQSLRRSLDRLFTSSWKAAESELHDLVRNTEQPDSVTTLARLGLVQCQILARLDVHGALTTLLPLLEELEKGGTSEGASRPALARAHVMAVLLFGVGDARVFDLARANAHAAKADALLEPRDVDLRVLLAAAQMWAARSLHPSARVRVYRMSATTVEQAQSPLARCLANELRGVMARLSGDGTRGARLTDAALALAKDLDLSAVGVIISADRASRAVHGTASPSEILTICDRGQSFALGASPNELVLRLFAAEVVAQVRLGQLAEAARIVERATDLAMTHGLSLYPLVPPAARLYVEQTRFADLDRLSERVTEASRSHLVSRPSVVELHQLYLRATRALHSGDIEQALSLAETMHRIGAVLAAGDADDLLRELGLLGIEARLAASDFSGAAKAVEPYEALLEEHPSLWHSAELRRLMARLLAGQGKFVEARQMIERALATSDLLRDVTLGARCRRELALAMALAADGSDAGETMVSSSAAASTRETLAERLARGVERLTMRGLPVELVLGELASVLAWVFPGRPVAVDDGTAVTTDIEEWIDVRRNGDTNVRIGVGGKLETDGAAALRILAAVSALALDRGGGGGLPLDLEGHAEGEPTAWSWRR